MPRSLPLLSLLLLTACTPEEPAGSADAGSLPSDAGSDGGTPGDGGSSGSDGSIEVTATLPSEPACSRDGWCWEAPSPRPDGWMQVWGSSPEDIWFAGGSGALMHWDGSTLRADPDVLFSFVEGVWGTSPSDVWAVGAYGAIAHYDGARWSLVDSGTNVTLLSVWASGPTDAWAAGAGGTLLHWDGVRWASTSAPTTADLTAVWGAGPNAAWAVSATGDILRWDGSTWSVEKRTDTPLRAVRGSSETDVWVVGSSGTAWHWDGASWKWRGAPSRASHLRGVWAPGPDEAYVVTQDSSLLRWHAGQWTQQLVQHGPLMDVFGFPGGDLWVASAPGSLLRRSGDTWARMQPTSYWGASLAILALSASDVWTVGYGNARHWDGQGWSSVPTGMPSSSTSSTALRALWAAAPDDIWGVGDKGQLRHWDGAAWSEVSSPTQADLYDVWGSSASNVWAVGRAGALLHWNGTAWSTVDSGVTLSLHGIWGSSADDVWVVGNDSWKPVVLRWNGTTWAQVPFGFTSALYSVWGSSPTDVWAVGEDESIYHWDGSAWSPVAYNSAGKRLLRVWGQGPNDVWAIGDSGQMRHWDGTAWSVVVSGTHSALRSIGGVGTALWAGAESSQLLRRR